jgi:hypothetical protein
MDSRGPNDHVTKKYKRTKLSASVRRNIAFEAFKLDDMIERLKYCLSRCDDGTFWLGMDNDTMNSKLRDWGKAKGIYPAFGKIVQEKLIEFASTVKICNLEVFRDKLAYLLAKTGQLHLLFEWLYEYHWARSFLETHNLLQTCSHVIETDNTIFTKRKVEVRYIYVFLCD